MMKATSSTKSQTAKAAARFNWLMESTSAKTLLNRVDLAETLKKLVDSVALSAGQFP
jgi:hypothetical protein